MKTSSLLIGLGIGLLAGVALGAYLASSEEDKAQFVDNIHSKMDKAKKTIEKVVNDGLEVAHDTLSKTKANPVETV